ncbi:hypothetical protein VTN96DRAFT_8178 [Rasamsonia emersonii]
MLSRCGCRMGAHRAATSRRLDSIQNLHVCSLHPASPMEVFSAKGGAMDHQRRLSHWQPRGASVVPSTPKPS